MIKTYKFRIYPTTAQVEKMEKTLGTCRFLYNDCLADRKNAYERTGITVGYYDQQYELKNREGINIHSKVAQDVLRRLQKAYDSFFRRVKNGENPGYPRFQGYDRYNSFTYSQSGFKILDNGKLRLSKIGDLKLIQHREIEGKIKTITVKREGNQWYASFSTELKIEIEPVEIKSAVGIDVGIKTLAVLSNGEEIPNIKTTNNYEKRLAKIQRKLSRMKKGSNNRKKQKVKVQNIHKKIKNVRNDYLHKQSTKLVIEWDLIVLEDLQIENMIKNHKLAKSIADVSWNKFASMMKYKAEWAGKEVVFVNPRNTSKTCSNCGYIQNMPLEKRIYDCPKCNLVLDRDYNAAINILNRVGTTQMSTPVEMFVGMSMNQEALCESAG
ncbi:MAG: RNA-guided endonuclease TnpB family protein [Methanosarcinaceae archaeon]|nr:RNA-guided endonuclease TnpB family protein [Methanosarcinaceae archaeon]